MKDKILKLFVISLSLIILLPVSSYAKKRGTIALVMKALSNPFFIVMKNGASVYAREHGIDLEVFGTERETEIDRQIRIVENLISSKYEAIVIAPTDSIKLIPICKKAMDRGIVVINVDNPFHKASLESYGITIPFVGSSNFDGATMVGEYIKHKLGGKGNVAIIEGIRGVENAELRKKGFIQSLTTDSDIQVVASETGNWHTDEAFTAALKLFENHQNIDAVLTANDSMALGVLQAIDVLGIERKILIGSYDNINLIRSKMANGKVHATIEQHPGLMGAYGVKLAHNALRGVKPSDYVRTQLDLITAEGFGAKVGISISHVKNPFFKSLLEEFEKTAKLHGMIVLAKDAHDEEAQQLIDLQNFIKQKVNAIVVNPTHAESTSIGIEFANAAGIPVITVDRKASKGQIISHITSDNLAGGKMAGRLIVKKLKRRGKILEFEGIPGTSAARDRGKGFNSILENVKGMEVVRVEAGFDREKARILMNSFLEKGEKFDAIFAHNDNMILGVIDAYEKSGALKPFLIGFDGIPDALEMINKKILDATIAQDPRAMGRISAENVMKHFRKRKLSSVAYVELKLIQKE